MKTSILATGLLGLASRAAAQIGQNCVSDVCYNLNIPADTASSGEGDIFIQITAPSTKYQYVALGQGSAMSGAEMFIIYTSASGNNVTLSPRQGTGHNEPKFSSSIQVSLLEGSGVTNGQMTANIRCSNCDGNMDFTTSSTDWIYALKSGSALETDDTSASISQHGEAQAFSWDISSAKGGNSLNPFVAAAGASGSSGTGGVTATNTGATGASATSSCVPRPTTGTFASAVSSVIASATSWPPQIPTQYRTAYPTGFPTEWRSNWPTAFPTRFDRWDTRDVNYCDSAANNGNIIRPIVSSKIQQQKRMIVAHGILAALAFVVLFPAGAISIRLCNFPGIIWLHAAFQVFAYIVYLAAFGLGVYIANQKNLLSNYHPIIGIVLFVVIFFQPIFGFLHHSLFKKYNTRTLWSHVHIWIGRIAITLGIINGGLGFKLANEDGVGSHNGMIAYAVIAAIAWLLMIVASIIGESKKRKTRTLREAPPKYEDQAMDTPLQSLNPSPERGPSNAHGYYGQRK